jgi:signal transduction histidine kinase
MSQDELPEGSSARRKPDQVIVASRRAQDLVRQILAFSRQGQGEKAPMRVAPVVKGTLKLLRASYPANVEIQSEIPTGTGVVLGNPSHIHQVILNLATNACQAMVENGGLLVFLSPSPA